MQNKKIVLRKDLVSRNQYPKDELIRIVKNKNNEIFIDQSGKQNGRGAYLFLSLENIETGKKRKVIEREFKVKDIDNLYDELVELCNE